MTATRTFAALGVAGFVAAAPWMLQDRPPIPDTSERCYPCHEEMQRSLAVAGLQVHDPVSHGQCGACHNPHAARHEHLLVADPAQTCGRCHEATRARRDARFVHAPFAQGQCMECHDGHAAPRDDLLARPPEDLCRGCHPPEATGEGDASAHAPVREGRCLTCHDPHGSDTPAELRDASATLCASCHPETEELRRAHGTFAIGGMDCTVCHFGHRSAAPGLLRPHVHAPVASLECDLCHVQREGHLTTDIVAPIPDLCFSCHGEETFRREVRHGPVADGDCTACHEVHASAGAHLLDVEPPDLCRRCHADVFPQGNDMRVHAPFAEGRCGDCHDPHSSANDSLTVRRKWLQLCEGCHRRHPHAVDVIPTAEIEVRPGSLVRMDDTGRIACLSCHNPHASPHQALTYYDKDRELCVQCHAGF